MTDTLMVGVSGIRGIVGKDLTDEVVGRYARAFGRWVKARTPVVVVGRDARESGPAFERAVVDGLGSVGCAVVKVGLVPTPTVQLAVEHHAAGGGIAITASHNPIEWNALKFIGPDGIFLDGADGARVLELAEEDGGGGGRTGKVTTDEGAVERHLDAVLKLPAVDVERIRKRKFTVALDAVRGAGGPVMRALLERLGCEVAGINLETDGRFPRSPEPVPENLGGLSTLVTRAGAALGIAVDPDVDRLAIVDENGTAIGEDYTLAFAVRAVLGGQADSGTAGQEGPSRSARPSVRPSVVCNLSTSLVVEDAARDCAGGFRTRARTRRTVSASRGGTAGSTCGRRTPSRSSGSSPRRRPAPGRRNSWTRHGAYVRHRRLHRAPPGGAAPARGTAAPRVPRVRLGRARAHRGRPDRGAQGPGQDQRARESARHGVARRAYRNRPHALG